MHAAASGSIRLRKDKRNAMPGIEQPGESALSEWRGSCED
jgi:hypothetical protein